MFPVCISTFSDFLLEADVDLETRQLQPLQAQTLLSRLRSQRTRAVADMAMAAAEDGGIAAAAEDVICCLHGAAGTCYGSTSAARQIV